MFTVSGAKRSTVLCRFLRIMAIESEAVFDDDLDKCVHIYLSNRGVLLTPFHSMVLVSPATIAEDVDLHNEVFEKLVKELIG